jgi:hypothetical protein
MTISIMAIFAKCGMVLLKAARFSPSMVILDTYFISKYMVNKTNTPEKIV